MPNHYHLLLEIPDPENLSTMMAGFARSYVHYYQKEYSVGGHIWQGRFKSQPVEKETYLLTCARYIERNPVKAKMVKTAEEYKYSSAKYYIFGKSDGITTEDPCFETFGLNISERRKNYAEFLTSFDEEELALFGEKQYPIGSPLFKTKLIYTQGRYMPRRRGNIPISVAFDS